MRVLENVTLAPRKARGLSRSDADAEAARAARALRARRQARRVPRSALGRAAAARRDRARARDAAEAAAARRGHERPRPGARRRGARRDPRARRGRDDDADRDPRDGLRARHREPGLLPRRRARSSSRGRPSRSSAPRARSGRGSSSSASSPPAGCSREAPGPDDGPRGPGRLQSDTSTCVCSGQPPWLSFHRAPGFASRGRVPRAARRVPRHPAHGDETETRAGLILPASAAQAAACRTGIVTAVGTDGRGRARRQGALPARGRLRGAPRRDRGQGREAQRADRPHSRLTRSGRYPLPTSGEVAEWLKAAPC